MGRRALLLVLSLTSCWSESPNFADICTPLARAQRNFDRGLLSCGASPTSASLAMACFAELEALECTEGQRLALREATTSLSRCAEYLPVCPSRSAGEFIKEAQICLACFEQKIARIHQRSCRLALIGGSIGYESTDDLTSPSPLPPCSRAP